MVVATFPGGVDEGIDDGLGVLVALGEGKGLTVAVLLIGLEVVELVEVEVFSVALTGATLLWLGERQPAARTTLPVAKIIRSKNAIFFISMRRKLT